MIFILSNLPEHLSGSANLAVAAAVVEVSHCTAVAVEMVAASVAEVGGVVGFVGSLAVDFDCSSD